MSNDPILRTFGDAVAGRRRVLGLTQREVAERMPASPQYICDIEHGRRSPCEATTIQCLAAALEQDPDDLFILAGRLPPDVARAAALAGPDRCATALEVLRAALTPEDPAHE